MVYLTISYQKYILFIKHIIELENEFVIAVVREPN